MSLIGLTVHFTLLFILVLIANLGSSIFHPAGANVSSAAGISKKDASFAIFATIGTFGFAFSQPLFSFFTKRFGIQSSVFLALPTVITAIIYFLFSTIEIQRHEESLHFKEFNLSWQSGLSQYYYSSSSWFSEPPLCIP